MDLPNGSVMLGEVLGRWWETHTPAPLRQVSMQCQTLCDRLDAELDTAAYADVDASANGLQVGSGEREIERVAFAVDTAVETITRAAGTDADLLVAHHGISFGGIERVTGTHYARLRALFSADCGLYVSHLPLDGHQTHGNAAGIGDVLGLRDREAFGNLGGQPVGQRGRLSDPRSLDTIVDQLSPHLDTDGREVQTLPFGPEEVSQVAIVTGSGIDFLEDAAAVGADLLITGEGKQHGYHEAKERNMNVILGGHYATETFGIRALSDLVSEWGLATTVIDCPTGL